MNSRLRENFCHDGESAAPPDILAELRERLGVLSSILEQIERRESQRGQTPSTVGRR